MTSPDVIIRIADDWATVTFRRPWHVAENDRRISLVSADGHCLELIFGQVKGHEISYLLKLALAHQIVLSVNRYSSADLPEPCSTTNSSETTSTNTASEP